MNRNSKPELLRKTYWRVVSPPAVLLSNAHNGKGFIFTNSELERHFPGIASRNDLDPMLGRGFEDALEIVRSEHFNKKPTRKGGLYLFESREIAQLYANDWYPKIDTPIVRARIVKGSNIHRGHIGWLQVPPPAWEHAARGYWNGDQGRAPHHWEVLVNGRIYFPDWEKPPFGAAAFFSRAMRQRGEMHL